LQQAIHGKGPGHVGRDFVDRLPLAARQRERKQPRDPGVDLAAGGQWRRLPLV
jgi:hypothetical protein